MQVGDDEGAFFGPVDGAGKVEQEIDATNAEPALPSPLWGGVGGGGPRVMRKRPPPTPTLPQKRGGRRECSWSRLGIHPIASFTSSASASASSASDASP